MRPRNVSRREFVGGLTLAGTAGLLGLRPGPAQAEPPPETTTIRLLKTPAVCLAPQLIAGELLKADGFTDVQYVVPKEITLNIAVGSGEADFTMSDVPTIIMDLERLQVPIVTLTGIHAGCYKLFGTTRVTSIRDLKGRTVSVPRFGFAHHAFVGSMAATVGLDPRRDIKWVEHPILEARGLFAEGKIDAFMTFEPEGVKLREQKIGHVLVDTGVDRPWAQYFCCLVIGNREFVRKNPVATKRVLRAMLKASEVCALEPERAARLLVDRGLTERYDQALQVLKELPSYGKWRQYSAADSVRFYALRFHEGGFIKTSPQTLLAQSTDWRFVNELKKELKG